MIQNWHLVNNGNMFQSDSFNRFHKIIVKLHLFRTCALNFCVSYPVYWVLSLPIVGVRKMKRLHVSSVLLQFVQLCNMQPNVSASILHSSKLIMHTPSCYWTDVWLLFSPLSSLQSYVEKYSFSRKLCFWHSRCFYYVI